jgi:hypothetical protein
MADSVWDAEVQRAPDQAYKVNLDLTTYPSSFYEVYARRSRSADACDRCSKRLHTIQHW